MQRNADAVQIHPCIDAARLTVMRTAILILVLGLSACHSSTPTAPTPPSAPPVSPLPPADRIVALSVLGDQWIALNGGPVQMTARVFTRVATSEGPGEFVDDTEHVTWSVESPGVVAIDRQGRVTPLASGTTRIIATLGERSARNPIRVLPNYTGTWAGNYIVTGCAGGVDFRSCPRLMFDETNNQRILYPFRLTLAQERDTVTGTLVETNRSFGDVVTPVTGFVRLAGQLVIEASSPREGLESFQLTNSSIVFNTTFTQITGAFTKILQFRSFGNILLTTRTEHEFTNISRAQ